MRDGTRGGNGQIGLQGREGQRGGPCVLREHQQRSGGNFLCFGSWRLSGSTGCREGVWMGEERNRCGRVPKAATKERAFPQGSSGFTFRWG